VHTANLFSCKPQKNMSLCTVFVVAGGSAHGFMPLNPPSALFHGSTTATLLVVAVFSILIRCTRWRGVEIHPALGSAIPLASKDPNFLNAFC
jgi:hypothetical protein